MRTLSLLIINHLSCRNLYTEKTPTPKLRLGVRFGTKFPSDTHHQFNYSKCELQNPSQELLRPLDQERKEQWLWTSHFCTTTSIQETAEAVKRMLTLSNLSRKIFLRDGCLTLELNQIFMIKQSPSFLTQARCKVCVLEFSWYTKKGN